MKMEVEVKGQDCATGVTLEILLRNARPDEFAWKFAVEARCTPRKRINSVTSNERRRWREKLGRRHRRKGSTRDRFAKVRGAH